MTKSVKPCRWSSLDEPSRPPEADYSLTAQADRIAVVLDVLGLEPAVVVAHAVGASMALRLAYRQCLTARHNSFY